MGKTYIPIEQLIIAERRKNRAFAFIINSGLLDEFINFYIDPLPLMEPLKELDNIIENIDFAGVLPVGKRYPKRRKKKNLEIV